MFRDIFLNSRALVVGLVFFVLVVGGSLLYSWHVHRMTDAELTETQRKVQPLKNDKGARTTANTSDTSTVNFEHAETPLETDDSQISDDTGVSPIDETSEVLDMADAFLPDDFVSEEEIAEDVPVSPFGFGEYPEVPADYVAGNGLPIWYEHNFGNRPDKATHERNVELIDRVLITLWKEGKGVIGGFYRYGKVYPFYSKTAYVKYYESIHDEGYSAGLTVMESSDFDLNLTIEQLENGDIRAGYQIFKLDDSGIDPYTFLGL